MVAVSGEEEYLFYPSAQQSIISDYFWLFLIDFFDGFLWCFANTVIVPIATHTRVLLLTVCSLALCRSYRDHLLSTNLVSSSTVWKSLTVEAAAASIVSPLGSPPPPSPPSQEVWVLCSSARGRHPVDTGYTTSWSSFLVLHNMTYESRRQHQEPWVLPPWRRR